VTLADIFHVETIGDDIWRARGPHGGDQSHLFGGQVAAQALRAATFTVNADHLPNSLHCYFLRRGRSDLPVDISVERVRGGRTYTSRRIDVRQEGRTIFAMLASFHAEEPGREFDHGMPSGVPDPDTLPRGEALFPWEEPLDLRGVPVESPGIRWWCRIADPFPDDPAMHFCALLYQSDLRGAVAAMTAVGFRSGIERALDLDNRQVGDGGSLDHAVWFHRTPIVTDWVFCDVRPLTVRDSRGLVLGTMFDRDARHIATFAQEMFLKEASPGPAE
jgi:acyl-CoA thioesterase-2